MSEHYTRNTVSVSAYCKKCIARYEVERGLQPEKQPQAEQQGLWGK